MDNTLRAGTNLAGGKYTIVRSLGKGTFGITYQANMVSTVSGELGVMNVNVSVAVKEFFMSDMNSRGPEGSLVEGSESSLVQNYRRKFRKEAENLSHLRHENIVKVLDIFDENNTTYYVMEFVDGESLDQYIQKCGTIPEAESIEIIGKVGSALQYMHDNRMLHLDLKPGNIMRGNDGRITLIDFGLSKQYDTNGEPESSTSLGLGTQGYAPIEQADYRQDGTFPATLDIYALGATMFKMLTGVRPPASSTMLMPEDFPESLFLRQGVGDNTIAAVRKAMAPSRRNRYQTVSAFLGGLSSNAAPVNPFVPADDKTEYANIPPQATAPVQPPVQPPLQQPAQAPERTPVNPAMAAPPQDSATLFDPNRTVNQPPVEPNRPAPPQQPPVPPAPYNRVTKPDDGKKNKTWLFVLIGVIVTAIIAVVAVVLIRGSHKGTTEPIDTFTVDSQPAEPQYEDSIPVADSVSTTETKDIPIRNNRIGYNNDIIIDFYEDSPEMVKGYQPTITKIAAFVKKNNCDVQVIGHVPYKGGSDAYTMKLSEKMAQIIKNKLVASGVPAASITTEGKGKAYNKKSPMVVVVLRPRAAQTTPEPPQKDNNSQPTVKDNNNQNNQPTGSNRSTLEDDDEIYVFVEQEAQFPGGQTALYRYLGSNIKYPELARQSNITGTVYLKFVVEKDGRITNAKIMKDIGGGCGAEALRVVKSMPRWTPAKQRGRAVRSEFSLPVTFSLK